MAPFDYNNRVRVVGQRVKPRSKFDYPTDQPHVPYQLTEPMDESLVRSVGIRSSHWAPPLGAAIGLACGLMIVMLAFLPETRGREIASLESGATASG